MRTYEKYKDSGISWIGKVPEDWSVRRIKYIGYSENGLTYSPNDITKNAGVLVLRSSNIQNNRLAFDDNVYVKAAPKKLMLHKGDIIICSRNGSVSLIGKSALIEEDMNATFGAFMLRFHSKYNSKYIYYLVSDAISKYKGLFATTTINQLTKSALPRCIAPSHRMRIRRLLPIISTRRRRR
jgi:type I restriction enzyme S subunit